MFCSHRSVSRLLTLVALILLAGPSALAILPASAPFMPHPGNPILSRGPNGAVDDNAIGRPCVIRVGDQLRMYYIAHGGSYASIQIRYATSEDGINWEKAAGAPLLTGDGSGFDALSVFDPAVLVDNGLYHMWFIAMDASTNPTIGHAVSSDGIHWGSRELALTRGPQGAFDYFTVSDPVVVKVGDVFYMWYSGRNGPTNKGDPTNVLRVGLATSTDGIRWEKHGVVLNPGVPGDFDEWLAYGPEIRYTSGLFAMYYTGQNYAGVTQIGLAISTDGRNWTKQGLVLPAGEAGSWNAVASNFPAVLEMGEGRMMWFSGDAAGLGSTDIGVAYQVPPLAVVARARLEPATPRTLDDLTCIVEIPDATDPPPLSGSFRWFRNGQELTQPMLVENAVLEVTGSVLSHLYTTKHDSIHCLARITDGTSIANLRAEPVVILNTPPTAPVVRIVPENPQPWDGLGVEFLEYSYDADGDAIGYEIRWYRSQDGGQTWVYRVEVSGVAPRGSWVPPAFLHEGDLWRVEAIPFEKTPSSKAGESLAADEERIDGEAGWDQVYVGENRRPRVFIAKPVLQNALAGPSVEIVWLATDDDGDPVTVDLYYDEDNRPGGLILIAEGLPASGSYSWTPPLAKPGGVKTDLNGDGRVAAEDLLRMAERWGLGPGTAASYRVFARAYDDKNAMGATYGPGTVFVTDELWCDVEGLYLLIQAWHSGP
ncbi:hypothetical protein HS125_03965 [bacterium]|nr:hypothetical protein [bacterium]